jgi:hypothetical protein
MGDICPGEPQHTGIPFQVPFGDLRQGAVVSLRQVIADFQELLVDHEEIVKDPLLRRSDLLLISDCLDYVTVSAEQYLPVFPDSLQEIAPLSSVFRNTLGLS